MARRVNTKFVVILSASLVGAVGILLGVKFYHWRQRQDPEVVKAVAVAAEKKGDLKEAAKNYAVAADLMARKRMTGADALFAYSADLAMKISREAQTQEDAVLYYQFALDRYKQALQENPRNKEVNQLLLEEDYQNAVFQPSIFSWKNVEEVAGKLIANQDSAKARLYRAEARLNIIRGTLGDGPNTEGLAGVRSDLDAAMKFEPNSGKALALQAQWMLIQASQSARLRGLSRAEDYAKDPEFQGAVASIRQTLIRFLEHQQGRQQSAGWTWFVCIPLDHIDTDVAAALASFTVEQYRLTGGSDRSRLYSAITLLEAAFNADTNQVDLADGLGTLYLATGQPEKTEALFKRIVQLTPEKPEAYYRLGSYYRDMGNIPAAIASFVDVTRHPLIGSGREARRNADYQIIALNEAAWLNLELAERPSNSADQSANYLKEAGDFTEKLRAANANPGLVALLDGRTMLIKNDVPHAVKSLRVAEDNLGQKPNLFLQEKYRQTELMMARANEMQNQLGASLEYIDKALEIKPGDIAVILVKAKMLVRLGMYEDTRILMGRLLGETVTPAGEHEFRNMVNLSPAASGEAMRLWTLADGVLQARLSENTGTTRPAKVRIEGSNLQTASLEMDMGDFESALSDALSVLEDATTSEGDSIAAYRIAINCCVQLKETDQARKLAADALGKHPQNSMFQVMKAQLDLPQGVATLEAQESVINAITDPFVKALSLAALYQRQHLWDKEITVLQAQRTALKSASGPDVADKRGQVLEQLFTANLAATAFVEGAARDPYWNQAKSVASELETLNLDGTEGKIYYGLLEFARTEGKSGLTYLQQAVAQRPDLAKAHLVLGRVYRQLSRMDTAAGAAASTNNANSALEEYRQVVRLAPNNLEALQSAIDLLVRKGDSSSLKEAQKLLESGLSIAPHNSVLIGYTEIFADKVDDSIKMRERLLERQPDDRDNIHRLASLYVRLKDKEANPEKKLSAMENAIKLVAGDFQKHPNELGVGDRLAHLLVEMDTSAKGASAAIQIYEPFVKSQDPVVRFNAMIAKAEFFHKLAVTAEAVKALKDAKLMSKDDPREEAAEILKAAIADEPKDQDDAERHLADMYFDLGRMADAESTYLTVLDKSKNPDTLDKVNRRLIEAQLRLGKFKDAEPRLADLLKKQPDDIQGLILHAFSNIQQSARLVPVEQQKALTAALGDLNHALRVDPENSDAMYYRALAELAMGDRLDDAEKDLIQAAKKDRNSVNARVLLAQLFSRTRRYEESSREYREILTLHPELLNIRVEYTDWLKSMAELQATLPKGSDMEIAKSLDSLKPAELLKQEVTTASQLYPNQARWPFLYAQTLELLGQDADAQRYYEALYKALPGEAVLCDAYLGSLLKSRDYAKVVEISSGIIDTNPKFIQANPQFVTFYLKRAAAFQGLGRQDEAIKDIDRGFAVGAEAAGANGNFGPFLEVLNQASTDSSAGKAILRPQLVAERLRVRIAANPSELISQLGLIQSLMIAKDLPEALKVVNTLKAPEDNPSLRFLVLRQSALVRTLIKQFDGAQKEYEELLKMSPDNVDVLNNYAFMLVESNKAKEAIPLAERAIKLLNTRSDSGAVMISLANAYDTLGYANLVNNDPETGIANLLKSIKTQPQAPAYLHLAQCYDKSGQKVEAQQKCEEGIKLAAARQDDETLAALRELQAKLAPSSAKP